MVPSNYESVPGVKKANFDLPYSLDLEELSRFFRKQKMKTKIRKGQLCANTNDTYIYVSQDGQVRIHSFKRIRPSYLCKRIAGFRVTDNSWPTGREKMIN